MRDIEALSPVVGKELLRTPRPEHIRLHNALTGNPEASSRDLNLADLPVAFSG